MNLRTLLGVLLLAEGLLAVGYYVSLKFPTAAPPPAVAPATPEAPATEEAASSPAAPEAEAPVTEEQE